MPIIFMLRDGNMEWSLRSSGQETMLRTEHYSPHVAQAATQAAAESSMSAVPAAPVTAPVDVPHEALITSDMHVPPLAARVRDSSPTP